MYYRYKSKRTNRKVYKLLGIFFLIAGCVLVFVEFRQYIFFWKYTSQRLFQRVDSISRISDRTARQKDLVSLLKICDDYQNENQLSPEGFFIAGKAHYLMGECCAARSFSELIINNGLSYSLNEKAHAEFLNAIKCINKGIVLADGGDTDPQYTILLARAIFYTGYYPNDAVWKIISKIDSFNTIRNSDDIRFIAVQCVLNGKIEKGLDILNRYGGVDDTVDGQLFLAAVYALASRSTNAIMEYKAILKKSSNSEVLKLAHMNLGKIYFGQSLYDESLNHFTNALQIDERDMQLKVWIGKSYSALGNKNRAKAIWSEVLAVDNHNEEVRKLLGFM